MFRRAQTVARWAGGAIVYWYILGFVLDKAEGLEDAAGHVREVRKTDENGERGEEEGEKSEEDVVIPDEQPEDALFIPLGWARQRPPVFYKGNDPEWQSFVAFSKDRQRGLSLRSRRFRWLS